MIRLSSREERGERPDKTACLELHVLISLENTDGPAGSNTAVDSGAWIVFMILLMFQ